MSHKILTYVLYRGLLRLERILLSAYQFRFVRSNLLGLTVGNGRQCLFTLVLTPGGCHVTPYGRG